MLLMVIVTLGSKKVKEAQVSKFGFNDFLPALKQFIQNKNFVVILLLIAFFRLSDTVLVIWHTLFIQMLALLGMI